MSSESTKTLDKFDLLLSYDIESNKTRIRVVKMDRTNNGLVVSQELAKIVLDDVENIESMYVMLINAMASVMFTAHEDGVIKSHISYQYILAELEKAFLSTSFHIVKGDGNSDN